MTDIGTYTGWRANDNGRSSYMTGQHTNQDIAATYTPMFDYVDCSGAERIVCQLVSTAGSNATIKFYTSDSPTMPNTTFSATEWDQEPDTSTTYTLTAGSRLKKALVGPIKWFVAVGSGAAGATATGSVVITNHLFA